MAIKVAKTAIKNLLDISLIDLEGEINSKGNYIFLSGLVMDTPVVADLEFTIILADKSFSSTDDSLESTLEIILTKIKESKFSNQIDLSFKNAVIKKRADLFMYEIKVNIKQKVL